MSKTREVRPFGARDKFGYLFGDLANDFFIYFASTYVNGILHKGYGYLSGNGRNYVSYCSLYQMLLQISVWDVS